METLLQDIRYGFRMLLKNPGFTAVAVLTLALGIGANTAIFSLVNSVVLRPLPFPESHELMEFYHSYRKANMLQASVSPVAFDRYRKNLKSFESVAGHTTYTAPANMGTESGAERVRAVLSTANFFSMLGASPELGRTFRSEEEIPGQHRVAIISHGLWQRSFGGDKNILSRTVRLDGVEHAIVGVMGRGFAFPDKIEMWLPFATTPEQMRQGVEFLNVVGRLKNGVTQQQAEAELAGLAAELRPEFGAADADEWMPVIASLHEQVTGDIRPALLVLLGAVGCVLLIACANVANLMLARSAARQKEIAIRGALGASSGRIARQLLTEGVLLGLVGGGLGLGIGFWGLDAMFVLSPVELPEFFHIGVDRTVLFFTLALSIVTGLVFAAFPAWQLARGPLNATLNQGGKSSDVGSPARVRAALVIGQTALAVVLLVGAGLLLKSFQRLQQADPGFSPQNLLTARVLLPASKYPGQPQMRAFYQQFLSRVETLPGVEAAGGTTVLPYSSNWGNSFEIPGKPMQPRPHSYHGLATPGYLKSAGLRLVRGRWFTEHDQSSAPGVSVVEESVAKLFWPNEDPIGKQIMMSMPGNQQAVPREIVGIVVPVKHAPAMAEERKGVIYHPVAQVTVPVLVVTLRTAGRPEDQVGALRGILRELDPDIALFDVRTGEELVSEYSAGAGLNSALLAVFAGVALVLSIVGIYGVVSYTVTRRTREVGVRMALGAQRPAVLRMFLREGVLLGGTGIALGLVAAFALGRFLSRLLFQVKASDPATFLIVAFLLGFVAVAASFVPARRATRVDPMVALRYE